MDQKIIERLQAICGEKYVFVQDDDVSRYLYDETEELVRPEAEPDCVVVRPGTNEEVSEILKLANEMLFPVIPRGGGTGACGAVIPTQPSVIMSMERFDKILEVDKIGMMVTAQTGVTLYQLNEYLDKEVHELYFPCHPGDEGAQLGGLAVENAGGVRAVKHGIMRSYVKGLKVCLPSGEIVQLGGKLLKNNMGYDLMHLIVGSEGTLCVVLEVTFKLHPRLEHTGTMVMSFANPKDAVNCVSAVQVAGIVPLAVEYMDRSIALKTGEEISKTWPLKDEGKVDIIFMLEGKDEDEVYDTAEKIDAISSENGAINCIIAESKKDQKTILDIRSAMYEVFKPYFVDSLDTAVPVCHVNELLADFDEIAKKYGSTTPRVGHVADGNFHNFILRDEEGNVPSWADDMRKDFYEAALKYGGTITAEHGTGKTRKPYMNLQYSPTVMQIMKGIKHAFDPNNILNPGCVFD